MPKESAVFGLPGHRENIVRLNADHSDMCRFDIKDQRDKDNLKIVSSNLEDVYKEALKCGESANDMRLPELNTRTPDRDLEDRMAGLNSFNFH